MVYFQVIHKLQFEVNKIFSYMSLNLPVTENAA